MSQVESQDDTKNGSKKKSAKEEELLKELCTSNGLNYQRLDQEGPQTTMLEMFFSGYPQLVGLHYFPNLNHLCIMGQTIDKIDGLSSCPRLKELWLSECMIKRLDGLGYSKTLRKLYLYDNQIEKIQHIDHLLELRVLDLHSNKITNIEGLQNLRRLEELNLADNNIHKIGHGLNSLSKLEILNLSGNKICSFKDITHLVRLPNLKSLGIKDPMYAPNPVCLLCNYSTHVLFHLPSLQRLDGYDVASRQTRELAEATVVKKKMFYNMRLKTIRQNQVDVLSKLTRLRDNVYYKVPHERLKTLYSSLKEVEREIGEVQSDEGDDGGRESGTESDKDTRETKVEESKVLIASYEDKMHILQTHMKKWENIIDEVDYHYNECCSKIKQTADVSVSRLVTELESGGNIRFEGGKPSDVWYTSCHDLLMSRFCMADFKDYGISGLKIHGVTRIHNRILHTQFEDKLSSLLDDDENYLPTTRGSGHKKLLEYLFWVWDPELPGGLNEPHRVLEEGFLDAATYRQLGRDGAVPLSNSLMLAERCRIQYYKKLNQSKPYGDPCPFRYGQVIIAKVYMGKSSQALDCSIQKGFYPKIDSVYRPRKLDKSLQTETSHGSCDCISRQCEWFVFDNQLVLPEYVVDLEYTTKFKPSFPFASFDGTSSSVAQLEMKQSDLIDSHVGDTDVLDMAPVVKPRPRLITLTEELLRKLSKQTSLAHITVLNLHGNGLSKLKPLSELPALRKLIVSFNDLTRLEDLAHTHLEYLDASFNKVTTLEGMKGMNWLKCLDISWNRLYSTREELAILRKHTPILTTLDFSNNPWQKPDGMRLRAIGRLKSLSSLNDKAVTEAEATAALRMAAGSRISQVSIMSHSRTDVTKPRSLALGFCAQVLIHSSWNKPDRVGEQDSQWYSKVTTLNLDGQHLSKLSNLDRMDNLKWLSLNNNDITKIEGLEPCENLEELSLEDNCITKLEGIGRLVKLKRLNLGDNYLSTLEGGGLDKLTSLYHLSIESNKITSLFGVQRMTSLVELYAGNNNITSAREVFYMKNLPNFLILDLGGNPVTQTDHYRLFVIYHLKPLKALDGKAIEANEAYQAKDLFGGRLTPDFVADRLGHSSFADVRELDLPNCAIRSVDLGEANLFINLRSVNLEHNNMTSFSGLTQLVNLRVLCLNHNHIECIVPKPKTTTSSLSITKKASSSQQQAGVLTSKDLFDPERYSPILENLEVLHLGYNGIKDMAVLQLGRLPSLKALFLQGNEISKLEGLEGLQDLRELVLDRNKIKDISDLSFMNQWNLQELHMEENRIRELSNLASLENLQRLYLGMNRIQEMAELEKLEFLPRLLELSVVSNAVSRRLIHRPMLVFRMPSLMIIDGIPVSDEERIKAEMYFMEQQPAQVMTTVETTLPGIGQYKAQIPVKVTNVQLSSPERMPWSGTIQYAEEPSTQAYRKKGGGTAVPSNYSNAAKGPNYYSQLPYNQISETQYTNVSDMSRMANYNRSNRK